MEFCDPEEVAEFEGTYDGDGALFCEFVADVVAVIFGADFTVVEDEVDGEGARRDGYRVEGWEGGCGGRRRLLGYVGR